ncbi:MAG: peptide ABC transporter ATP-binding protein [Rhodobacteraceae bacterium]|nr:peptide ABC transporter ATP-binding protein [Paracoccaceae bacterium]MAY43677.1 peptide ABC transporter ATP-binding protein [Paracoccaceae bacterium]QEW22504.1 putative D,D-dipeptide transport ATP-binding protein DdpD [Marinibacterium anthonyi]
MYDDVKPSSVPSFATADPAVAVDGLCIDVPAGQGFRRIVDDVSFAIPRGRVLGLVGESGSGKSLTGMALNGLLQMGGARISGGTIRLAGRDVTNLSDRDWRPLRGAVASMVFQDPLMSLNPVHRVGWQIAEALIRHKDLSRRAAWAEAVDMLDAVGVPDPKRRARSYPHQLSGGMRQRVGIAMALACGPDLLIADEPTTALDVTIQAQILQLIDRMRRETGAAVLFISHDLSVVSQIADDVAVIYAGRIVETGPCAQVFAAPEHPYTIGLLGSMPDLDRPDMALVAIPGAVPAPDAMPDGCRFAPRCPFVGPECTQKRPEFVQVAADHRVACARLPVVSP